MRKMVKAAGLGVLLGLSMAAVAGDNNSADTRAYLNFNFGGDRSLKNDWHTGLQLSSVVASDARPGEFINAGSMKLDFSNRGNALLVNGVPLVSKAYRLQQAEGEVAAEAAAEEGGFFSGIGDFFSNLFGGGEEEAVEGEGEAAAAEATEEVAEESMFDGYTTGDWALLGVGVLGAGYLIAEAASSDEDGNTTGGGGEEEEEECPVPLVLGVCLALTEKNQTAYGQVNSYQQWLDEGTGQMGDLVAQ